MIQNPPDKDFVPVESKASPQFFPNSNPLRRCQVDLPSPVQLAIVDPVFGKDLLPKIILMGPTLQLLLS